MDLAQSIAIRWRRQPDDRNRTIWEGLYAHRSVAGVAPLWKPFAWVSREEGGISLLLPFKYAESCRLFGRVAEAKAMAGDILIERLAARKSGNNEGGQHHG